MCDPIQSVQEIGEIPSPEHPHYRDRLDVDRFRLTRKGDTMDDAVRKFEPFPWR